MLKVIVDATPITAKPSGVGLYVANLVYYLATLQERENFEISLFYQPSLKNWLQRDLNYPDLLVNNSELEQNIIQNSVLFPYPVRVSNWLLNNTPQILTKLLDRQFPAQAVFHGTNFTVYPDRKNLKVMTLYDLTFLRYPQYIDKVVAKYYQRVKKCLQWTDLIITISESTKQDAVTYLNIPPERIEVTPLASRYSRDYLKLDEIRELKQTVDYDFNSPYLLFVSTIEPRKNIISLIEAFNYLKQQYKIEHNLILIGKKGWRYQGVFDAITESAYRDNIYHLDYLNDKLVALFYQLATAFIYPSHYEGFGLPVLEAMTLGTPVICSNTSSLPEVVGDAALTINPEKPLELAEAILQVIDSDLLRQKLIDKGYQQASLFSWEKTAQKTLEAYFSLNIEHC